MQSKSTMCMYLKSCPKMLGHFHAQLVALCITQKSIRTIFNSMIVVHSPGYSGTYKNQERQVTSES